MAPAKQKPGLAPLSSISVVIPSYNEEAVLGETLEHLNRTRTGLAPGRTMEIIVSDDGSSDRTVEIARDGADRVVMPRPGDRVGPGAARNRGAAIATGDLLIFIDADCLPQDPERFMARACEAFGNPRLVAATCRLAVQPDVARLSERMLHRIQDRVIWLENLVGIHTAGGWCQMAPRVHFEKVGGYSEDLMVSQDVDLFMRLGKLGTTRLLLDLTVHESPWRYREQGLLRTYLARLANSVALFLGLRPPARSYRAGRAKFH